jgi:hypothetical protein
LVSSSRAGQRAAGEELRALATIVVIVRHRAADRRTSSSPPAGRPTQGDEREREKERKGEEGKERLTWKGEERGREVGK